MAEGFHWSNHLFFKRMGNGAVRIQRYALPGDKFPDGTDCTKDNWEEWGPIFECTFDKESWQSIIASVCANGDNAESYEKAKRFHSGD